MFGVKVLEIFLEIKFCWERERERMSDCVVGLVLLFCVYSFFLINMVLEKILFWKKVFMFNFSLKRISGNDLLWIIVMLRLLKVGVF